jgi:RHS repeat-associated protein
VGRLRCRGDTTTAADHLSHDSFGNATAQSNSAHTPLCAYTGRERDGDVDLYFYRAGRYDPAVGRFLAENPVGLRLRTRT